MVIGLLQCDYVDDEFRHISGDYSDMFVALFADYLPAFSLKVYNIQAGEYPKTLDECDGYISTGSRYSVYDDIEWVVAFRNFVRALYEDGQKFVGICFGHQMIAHALGGKCEKAKNGWGVGTKRVEICQNVAWMSPQATHYDLIVSHQDQVTKLPANSTVLGGNDYCPNSMFTVGKHFLGIQAHPEVFADYLLALLAMRTDSIGDDVIADARISLQASTHHKMMAKWIVQFFHSES